MIGMLRRYAKLMFLVVIGAGVAGVFQVKYRVQALQNEVASLTRDLDNEREALHVAAAEWAYLNRPERLQVLSDKYLTMGAIATTQIMEVVNVPMRESELAEIPKQEMVAQPVSLEHEKP